MTHSTIKAYALLSVAAATSTLLATRADVGYTAACFVHYGPQDKTLPGFCVENPASTGTAEILSDADFNVTADPSTWAGLLEVLRARDLTTTPSSPALFGEYELILHPAQEKSYLPPDVSVEVIDLLLAQASTLARPIREALQNVLTRLGAPKARWSREW